MSVMALGRHSALPRLVVMEDDFDSGIFLFKDSQKKVVELAVVETAETKNFDEKVLEAVKKTFRAWIDRIQRPFLGKPVVAVEADQLQQEAKVVNPSEADLHLKPSSGGRKRTRANRRHKIKTRRQRALKSRK